MREMNNLETVKMFTESLETKNMDVLQAMLADDFTAKGTTVDLSKQQIVSYLTMLFTAFPDMSFGINNFEETGDLIYCDTHKKGTHSGILDLNPFGIRFSLSSTGKTFTLPRSRYTFRVMNGKITYLSEEEAEGGGLAGLLAQLGVKLPENKH